jgi:hypothetical protein
VTGVQTCALPISPKPQNPVQMKLLFMKFGTHLYLSNKLHENIVFSERFIYHSKEDIKEIEKY